MELSRRQTIGALGSVAALAAAGPLNAQASTSTLSSDIGTLKRVLVHSLSTDDIFTFDRLRPDLVPNFDSDTASAVRQHAGLIALLKANGTDVVELADALDAAIAATRGNGLFEAWLRASFPLIAGDPGAVTGAMLLGRDRASRLRLAADGSWDNRFNSTEGTIWTRDSAVMTPRGLLICNAVSPRRRRENMLLRFVYRHSPLLARYPIVFDAVEEGIHVEGGDMMFVSPELMLLGVGNRTDPRIAPLLARRLGMDVVTVQTVKRDFIQRDAVPDWNDPLWPLRILLLHLDTYFTLVGPRHGLAVPWLLESAHAADSPLTRFIEGARLTTQMDSKGADAGLEMLKGFGKVTFHARNTGKVDTLGDMKLVDWLRQRGTRLTFVGGERPSGDQAAFRHFIEVVLPETRRQAANVVQATPGRVIAYAGNPATKGALERDGLGVDTFDARELWAWHGGPHCLTQPLERA